MLVRWRFLVAALVALCSFVLYLVTLAPTVGFVDSGALTVAAWGLGVAHPPGFPLYTLFTHFFTLLPVRSVAWRANLASAFFAAIACGAICLAAAEILLARGVAKSQRVAFFSASAAAGLLLMASPTLWRYATIAEVYALNTALIALVLWLVFWWRREQRLFLLLLAAIGAGLALGVHHLTVVLTLAALLVLVPRKPLIICLAIAILTAALVYTYLPWAASRDPVLNWGNPDNWTRVVRHVTAEQYRSYVSAQPATQLGEAANLLWFAFLLGMVGLFQAWRNDRSLFFFLIVLSALPVLWLAVYPITHDEDAYLLPAVIALTLAAAYGVFGAARGSAFVVAVAFLAIPIAGTVVHWRERDRSEFHLPRKYVSDALAGMKQNALLFTGNWQLYSPLFYFRQVERLRPDVKPVEYGMLIRSWYLDSLERRYPGLMSGVRIELDSYRALLAVFENEKKRWNSDPELQQRLNERLDELVLAMMRKQRESGGHVYASPDVAMSSNPIDRNLVRRLGLEYQIVPAGLVLELVPRGYPIEVHAPPLVIPDLSDVPHDDVVMNEVIPSYRTALELRR